MDILSIKMMQIWKFSLYFKLNKPRLLLGSILSIIIIGLCWLAEISLIKMLIFVLAMLLLSFTYIDCPTIISGVINELWMLGAVPLILVLTQLMMNNNLSFGLLRIVLGLICCGIVLVLIYSISFDHRISVIMCMGLLLLLTTINYFVLDFRGSELAPADLLAFGTALAVAGQYEYAVTSPFAYAWIVGMVYCYGGFCIPNCHVKKTRKNIAFLAVLECIMAVILGVGIQYITPQHFAQNGSVLNGFLVNFVSKYESVRVKVPDQYSVEQIYTYEDEYKTVTNDVQSNKSPNIVMIMCESYADLRVLGDVNTDVAVMPFFDSLEEDTIKGYARTSVFGGGTCNSEYEVLTGNSMAFFPDSSYPYQQFVKHDSWSLIAYLESIGYHTLATHPENGGNWMRTTAYPRLGFDEMHFIEEYPRQNLLRGHVSDQEMYEEIIKWYEEKSGENPLFMLGVTMQNHSNYEYEGPEFSETVHLSGYSKDYPDVDQYLTLVNRSDAALEYLINYFKNVEEDVIVVFWGDHFPSISTEFYRELYGKDFASLDDQMLQYSVPFAIWANYDIEEQYIESTSLNFISNYVLETAGISLSPYHKFLSDLHEVIPSINSMGFYSTEKDQFVPFNYAEGLENEWLSKYEELQYNSLLDVNKRSKVFFQ